ncbi:DUF4198 domain-containing protein [Cribrihabitans pelagius]|uniref:DUF4198 domain-containing protein n=1 Tax=Cribrihabitans pelagius TaxID=1765746 RepID=UPI003B5BA5A9
MRVRLFCQMFFFGLASAAAPGLCHEFWIAPEKYQAPSGTPLTARLRNGEHFKGAELPYLDHRIARFELISGSRALPYEGRSGDMPALQAGPVGDGLWLLLHQTEPQNIRYDDWEAFQTFAEEKGLSGIRARHLARGLPGAGFSERYTRYAKALAAISSGAGRDRETGLETEFVALENPYTSALTALPVRLLYQGGPRPRAQVEIFARAPDGSVTRTTAVTSQSGEAEIPVLPGHQYLLNAVVLRPAPDGEGPVWESLWASLTFAVPGE